MEFHWRVSLLEGPNMGPFWPLGSRLKVQGRHEVAPPGDVEIVNQMMIALGRHTFHRAAYDKPQKKNQKLLYNL